MKHSNAIKIAAAVTAAPRWAIALMPADGAMFPWSSTPWFEIASGVLSLCFAVVEIWATSYIMQAWHEAQAEGNDRLARNLRRLWVATLIVLAAALVPPMYANVMRVNVNTFAPGLLAAWLVCVAASTFLVIGGVGYADRAQPVASNTDTAATDTATETQDEPQAQPAETLNTPAVLVQIADSATEAQPATASDVLLAYYAAQPDANQTQAAQHVAQVLGKPYSRQAVKAQLDRLERDGLIARNGHVEVVR